MRWSAVGSGGLALFLSSGVLADGMPRRAVAYEPAFSWTGFYFGANAGYSWGRADTDLAGSSSTRTRLIRDFGGANTLVSDNTTAGPAFIAGATADVDGWLGGGQIGYNWQAHRWVFGIEADIQATSEDGGVAFCSTVACGAGSAFATASYKLDWFGTVRGRLGHLLAPHALLYVTGGLAYGHLDADYTAGLVGGPTGVFSGDKTKAGWVIGGGAEWAIDRNWLLRAEYLYMDLGDIASAGGSATSTTIIPPFGNQPFTTVIDTTANAALRTEFTDHIFRVGLSYKFGCCAYAAPLK